MTEVEIRDALLARLAASAAGKGAAFIPEMFVDGFSRRADLVMANGKLAVFEIKSERDTLDRLPGQLQCYERFFEQVTVVCAEKHRPGVEKLASDKTGIWLVREDGSLSVVRKAETSSLPSLKHWLSFLPVDELRKLMKREGLKTTGTRDKLEVAAQSLSERKVRRYVLDFLKRREERINRLRAQSALLKQAAADQQVARERWLHEYLKKSSCSTTAAIPRRID